MQDMRQRIFFVIFLIIFNNTMSNQSGVLGLARLRRGIWSIITLSLSLSHTHTHTHTHSLTHSLTRSLTHPTTHIHWKRWYVEKCNKERSSYNGTRTK